MMKEVTEMSLGLSRVGESLKYDILHILYG